MAITGVHLSPILEKILSALTGPESTINNHSFSVDVDAIYHKQRITAALL